MAFYSDGRTTFPDLGLFLFFILLPFLSVPLNSLVIRHNYLKPSSLSRTLYLILSTTDLMACPFLAIGAAEGVWVAKGPNCNDQERSKKDRHIFCDHPYLESRNISDADIPRAVHSALGWGLQCGSIVITGVFTIVKFLRIRFPLRPVPKTLALVAVASGVSYGPVVFTAFLVSKWPDSGKYIKNILAIMPVPPINTGSSPHTTARYTPILSLIAVPLMVQLLGLMATVSTAAHLFYLRRYPVGGNIRSIYGTVKVLLVNFSSFVSFAMLLSGIIKLLQIPSIIKKIGELGDEPSGTHVYAFVVFVISPLASSTLNPVIYLTFTKDARKWK